MQIGKVFLSFFLHPFSRLTIVEYWEFMFNRRVCARLFSEHERIHRIKGRGIRSNVKRETLLLAICYLWFPCMYFFEWYNSDKGKPPMYWLPTRRKNSRPLFSALGTHRHDILDKRWSIPSIEGINTSVCHFTWAVQFFDFDFSVPLFSPNCYLRWVLIGLPTRLVQLEVSTKQKRRLFVCYRREESPQSEVGGGSSSGKCKIACN